MANATPILSYRFLANYSNWLKLTGWNVFKLVLYLLLNCMIINLFSKFQNDNLEFGADLTKAPYFYSSIPAPWAYGENKIRLVNCNHNVEVASGWNVDHNSKYLAERIIPQIFNLANGKQLWPYNLINNGIRVAQQAPTSTEPGQCKVTPNDTFVSYYISIIANVMWAYRYSFKVMAFWMWVGSHQSKHSYIDAARIKLLLAIGPLILLLMMTISFLFSMGKGFLAAVFEHKPSEVRYNAEWITGPEWTYTGFPAQLFTTVFYTVGVYLLSFMVGMFGLFSGLMLWAPFGPIMLSFGAWMFYPWFEFGLWNFGKEENQKDKSDKMKYPSTDGDELKPGVIITDQIRTILHSNKQFITFLILLTSWYSAGSTMNRDFNTGLGLVVGLIGVFFIGSGVSSSVKSSVQK